MASSKTLSPGMILKTVITAILFLASSTPVFSQVFGQNKVQYRTFDWKYLQSPHFDVYFYQEGEDIAQFTAFAAESALVKIVDNVGYEIKNRIPILVYNSHNEFQQNNAIDEFLPEGVGGVTELFKNRIVVPFEGDYEKFRHVIHHELLHAYMNDMYYGGSIQNIISQNIRLQFPLWFSEGMAEYQSLDGNDKANDMFIRDAVIYDYLPPIDYIGGYMSYRGGQSFFAWLADEYGKEKIGDLMVQIKAFGDVYDGFQDVYHMSLEELDRKWHKSLKQTYWPDITTRQEMNDFALRLTDARRSDGYYNTAPSLSPNGKKILYISNRDDYFDVFIKDVETGEVIDKLVSGNASPDYEELHLLTPGLCWSSNGRKVAISVKSGSKDAIYIIDVNSYDATELPLKFDGIFSVQWSPTSNKLALRGDNAKQSDIYIYDLTMKKLQRVTNDLFSDLEPRWSSDGSKIYFTSDRGSYTDPNSIPVDFDMIDYDYNQKDIYVYDLNTATIQRFTDIPNATESSLVMSEDGKKVLYISDRNGINNIWLRDLETGKERPITNSLDPIAHLTISKDGKRIAFNAFNQGGYDIFYMENPFDIDLNITELPNTVFVEKQLEAEKREDSISTALKKDSMTAALKKADERRFNTDSSVSETDEISDSTIAQNSDGFSVPKDSTHSSSVYGDFALNLKSTKHDSVSSPQDNVDLKLKGKEKRKFQLSGNTNPDGSFKVNDYKVKFSPDLIYSNANYSSFYGVQGVAQLAFSDILGNHRIFVATSLVLDLKNSDYSFAYYYLPKRIDYGISAYHSARFLLIGKTYNTSNLYRYRTIGGSFTLSYPINRFKRFDAVFSFNRMTKENLDNPIEPTQKLDFFMPLLSYVHDNTLWGYTSPMKGSRYALSLLGTPKIGGSGVEFISAILDYRTYLKLADDYNFAIRLNAGASFGRNPQRFYMGGTEAWINYEIQNNVLPIEELSDFAFSMPVMPLRGYNYNARSGTKFALLNAEFRFPLFRYLVFGALPLGFQNIQGVLFTDIGAVYNNRTFQLFQKVNGGFATKDLMVGVGVGTRLFFLYFPLKFDVAWSYDMQHFSDPKYYISLGADF